MEILKMNLMGIIPHQIKASIKRNIGLPEILVACRHILISLHSWIFSPFLIRNYDKYTATLIMFVSSVLITYIFIKISDSFKGDWFKIEGLKNGDEIKSKTILVRILILFSKKKSKAKVSKFLFLTEPLLFILYYREGHHLYNGIPDKKTWLLLLIVSLNACILWAIIIIVFNSFGILASSSIVVIFFMVLFGIYLF